MRRRRDAIYHLRHGALPVAAHRSVRGGEDSAEEVLRDTETTSRSFTGTSTDIPLTVWGAIGSVWGITIWGDMSTRHETLGETP